MAVGGLLRGLVSPPAWLPCHELFASWHHWLPSLPRLRPPASDGFKLLLVLLLFSAALAEVRYIASSSMAPTLRPGDRAVAEKVTYLFRRPSIGDIVFFKVPTAVQNYGVNKDVVFIKRVLATPGDFIELIVNGVALKEHYAAATSLYTMEAMMVDDLFLIGWMGGYLDPQSAESKYSRTPAAPS
uniref:Peptidase S26 domain-containing protein n=1 Tax=Zea mays TaxID=4577 RepID=A0A804RMK3_MAIZE